jgi:lipoyl synthase
MQNSLVLKNSDLNFMRKPLWLKSHWADPAACREVDKVLNSEGLVTVCREAKCPNQAQCWQTRTATLMILGDTCSRSCRFCAVNKGKPIEVDPEEPLKIVRVIKKLKLEHAVLTSVCRDDLKDQGAGHWTEVIKAIRKFCPEVSLEVLIPDFSGYPELLKMIFEQRPDVLNHNVETVPSLTKSIRNKASWEVSIKVLKMAYDYGLTVKTGMMLGLGETDQELKEVLNELYLSGARLLTLGQYLRPLPECIEVNEYVSPEKFLAWEKYALEKGFWHAACGPLVRSSYQARKAFLVSKKFKQGD